MQGCHRSETVRTQQDRLETWRSMPSTTLWSLRKPSRSISREKKRPKTVPSSRNASIFVSATMLIHFLSLNYHDSDETWMMFWQMSNSARNITSMSIFRKSNYPSSMPKSSSSSNFPIVCFTL